jgi:hypothetical protein
VPKSDALLSKFFFDCESNHEQFMLEEFMHKFEKEHGKTDITRRYTSMLPVDQQQFLRDNFPDVYMGGLPPFVKGYIQQKMERAARAGNLDDTKCPHLLRLFIQGKFKSDDRGRN